MVDDRLNARSSNLKMRFLFLAIAFLEVRKPSKPCVGERESGESIGIGETGGK